MSTGTRLSANQGFSLTEVLMVVAGAVIVLGIAIPVVDTAMDGYRVTLAAQAITSQLQFARMKSVSSNESFRVSFPSGRVYQVETSTGDIVAGPFSLPVNINWNTVDAGDGITFPGRYVQFTPTGNVATSGPGSAGRAKLISRGQVRVDVLVDIGGVIRQTQPYHNGSPPF